MNMKKIVAYMLTICLLVTSYTALAQDKIYTDSRGNKLMVPDNAWATHVIEFIPGNPWTKHEDSMDENAILGVSDSTNGDRCLTLGTAGSIVLEFDVLINDGEGNDIYVFETGFDVEPTKIEVSSDLKTWYYVGNADGSFSGVDLNGKVPDGAKFKFVRITDLGKNPNSEHPGADIDAVAGLNTKVPAAGSEWANTELEEADMAGLIPKTLENKDLTGKITRGEFAAVSVRLYEILTGKKSDAVNTLFTDIENNENKSDIEKAYGLNIAIGYSDTEFAPDMNINREQLATMLCRTIKKYRFSEWSMASDEEYTLDYTGAEPFADDAEISDYAKPSVYYMAKMGIIKGYDETHFAPKNTTAEQEAQGYATATREQALALALRIYKLSDALNAIEL